MQPMALLQFPHAGDGFLLFLPPPAQGLHSANPWAAQISITGKNRERRKESKGKPKFVGGRGVFRLCWNAASKWNLCTLPRSQVTDVIAYTEGDSCRAGTGTWDPHCCCRGVTAQLPPPSCSCFVHRRACAYPLTAKSPMQLLT